VRTVAVLPVKTFGRAKQRISAAVDPDGRRALAEAMVGDVLDALARVGGIDALVVVTAEPRARALAGSAGARVVHDDREAGQSAAALLGVRAAIEDGADRALLVPGDCPALDPGEVDRLLDAHPSAGVVIVPDRHGPGTNALLLSPPGVIAPAFGPGSFARHTALAHSAGVTVRVAEVASLGLDIDTPDDLAALGAALDARPGGAARTRALLGRLSPALS
jgi:2-phospho-L-lactate guanylyltransferase